MDELRMKLEDLFKGFEVEVRPTDDEGLPPYHVALSKDKKQVAHVHVSEPDFNLIVDELKKDMAT